jgi:2-polyprenyl-3-methyl-5-hydroxy-6-metoxy-1,4-benzoquinol methylase
MNKYYIDEKYIERDFETYFNDINNKDRWQNEVYFFAKKIFLKNNLNTVLDYGCGSGFKLLKYFKDHKYTGIDLDETIKLINKENFLSINDFNFNISSYDLVICSDVIEHVIDPDIILNNIKKINCKFIIFSTPDRNLLYNKDSILFFGPPKNIAHIREWTFSEFNLYISNNGFEIIKHFISNSEQSTQCLLAKIKK